MLITLLLLTRVAAEWVEISQQYHYSKPLRPASDHPMIGKLGEERSTKANRIYINHSLQYDWNKGTVFKIPNVSSKRVQLESSTVRNWPEKYSYGDEPETQSSIVITKRKDEVNRITVIPRHELPFQNNKIISIDEKRATEHRFHNKGNVQRIRLTTTEIPRKPLGNNFKNKPTAVLNLSDIEYATEGDIFTTIEIGDDFSNLDHFTHKKHLSAVLPAVEDKPRVNFENKHELVKDIVEEAVERIPEFANNVKQGQITSTTIKSTSIHVDQFTNLKGSNPKPGLENKGDKIRQGEKLEQDINRIPNIGKIKRVHLIKSTSKTTNNEGKVGQSENDNINYDFKGNPNVGNTVSVTEKVLNVFDDSENSNIDKIDPGHVSTTENIGTVKPKTHINTQKSYEPIKKPNVPNPEDVMLQEILQEDIDKLKNNAHRTQLETVMQEKVQNINNIGKINRINLKTEHKTRHTTNDWSNTKNRVQSIQPETSTEPDDKIKHTNQDVIKHIGPNFGTELSVQQVNINNTNRETQNKNKHSSLGTVKHHEFTEKVKLSGTGDLNDVEIVKQVHVTDTEEIPIRTTLTFKPIQNVIPDKETAVTTETGSYNHNTYQPVNALLEPKPEFVTKDETLNVDESSKSDFVGPTASSDIKIDKKVMYTPQPYPEDPETEIPINQYDDKVKHRQPTSQSHNMKDHQYEDDKPDETKYNKTKENPMENLVKILKVITDIISKNTRKSFKGKLRYLEDLRDTIMANIEERIEASFPDDAPDSRRRSRSAHATPRGHHVEFPSSESALMTISFLTFAVFLIKLVLQVIQTYKNKTMMMPAVVATVGRAYGEL